MKTETGNGELLIIRGIPGSGKTTLAEDLMKGGYWDNHYETDKYFITPNGEYRFNPSKLADAHDDCFNKVQQSLMGGYNTIVSNTFIRYEEFQRYIDVANNLNIPYKIIICQGNFDNVHNIPTEKVKEMEDRFEF